MLSAVGVGKVALVYQDDAYGKDILAAWQTHSRGSDISIVSEHAVARGSNDVEGAIDAALNNKPGAVVLALVSTPALRAAKRVRDISRAGVYSMMMSVAATSEVINALQGTGRGAVLFSSVMPLPTGGTNRLMLDYAELRKKHKLQPSFRGFEAYVALRIVADQVRRMGSVTATSLGQSLANAQSFVVSDITMRAREPRFADVFVITKAGVL